MCECADCCGGCCACEHGCKPFWKFIKDFDIFGHPVQLNFNKNGATHKTMIGGVASVGFYFISVIVALAVLAGGEDNKEDEGTTNDKAEDGGKKSRSSATKATNASTSATGSKLRTQVV